MKHLGRGLSVFVVVLLFASQARAQIPSCGGFVTENDIWQVAPGLLAVKAIGTTTRNVSGCLAQVQTEIWIEGVRGGAGRPARTMRRRSRLPVTSRITAWPTPSADIGGSGPFRGPGSFSAKSTRRPMSPPLVRAVHRVVANPIVAMASPGPTLPATVGRTRSIPSAARRSCSIPPVTGFNSPASIGVSCSIWIATARSRRSHGRGRIPTTPGWRWIEMATGR